MSADALLMLAGGVRLALLAWQRERFPHLAGQGTRGLCGVASLAAVAVARNAGVSGVEVGWGYFGGFPHSWLVLRPESPAPCADPEMVRRGAEACFYDLTVDQFVPDAPPVAVVPPGDPARACYRLAAYGPEAEADVADPSESDDALLAAEVVALFYARSGLAPGTFVVALG